MTSHIFQRVTDCQPAIILATALTACLSHQWPVVAAVFLILQAGIVLAVLAKRHPRVGSHGIRFLARAIAIPQTATQPPIRARRAHLHLVP